MTIEADSYEDALGMAASQFAQQGRETFGMGNPIAGYEDPSAPTVVDPTSYTAATAALGDAPATPTPTSKQDKVGDFLTGLAGGASMGMRGPRGGYVSTVLAAAGREGGQALTRIRAQEERRQDLFRQETRQYNSAKAVIEVRSAEAKTDAEWKNASALDVHNEELRKGRMLKAAAEAPRIEFPQDGIMTYDYVDAETGESMKEVVNLDHAYQQAMLSLNTARALGSGKSSQKITMLLPGGERVDEASVQRTYGDIGTRLLQDAAVLVDMQLKQMPPSVALAVQQIVEEETKMSFDKFRAKVLMGGLLGDDARSTYMGLIFTALLSIQQEKEAASLGAPNTGAQQ
jgi:hypothetical protein